MGAAIRQSTGNFFAPSSSKRVTARLPPDVPMDVVGLGATEWADVVVDAITRTGDEGDVILVGHSLAGLVLPVIAVKTPIQRMVFLCALVPTPGQSWGAYVTDNPSASTMPWGRVIIDDQNRMVMPWDLVRERFYQDCDEDQARAAFSVGRAHRADCHR
jgi:pimeloyl-ACP methyl ester carboxylesterase